jgi:hypothetical protein
VARLEYKYLVPRSQLSPLRRRLAPFVELDPYAATEPDGEYTVRSIYFDTPGLDCYTQKLSGIHTRRKIRIRCYGTHQEDAFAILEIKRKADMRVSKNRSFIFHSHLHELLASGDVEKNILIRSAPETEQALRSARAFLFHLFRYSMYPVVLVVYEREAFLGRFDPSVRLTFDKRLRSRAHPRVESLFAEEGLSGAMGEHFILEVKFQTAMPTWVESVLEEFELERRALSKYSICLEEEGLGNQSRWSSYLSSMRGERPFGVDFGRLAAS